MIDRVQKYWDRRAKDFSVVRRNELNSEYANLWLDEILEYFEFDSYNDMKVLDVGTGSGFFSILLSENGFETYGIDISENMLIEANKMSVERGARVEFIQMDSGELQFDDNFFDMVISRNLTWTLPDVEKAYNEWSRVLKKNGVLLNFDANYYKALDEESDSFSDEAPYGHSNLDEEMRRENKEITLSMPSAKYDRPKWDVEQLKNLGYKSCGYDLSLGDRILGYMNLNSAPMFKVWGIK